MSRTVAIVTLGCARNEVDSEELAGRLAADGWTLVDDVELAEVALVNTCGFIESAKKDSIDALLEANSLKGHGVTRAVIRRRVFQPLQRGNAVGVGLHPIALRLEGQRHRC